MTALKRCQKPFLQPGPLADFYAALHRAYCRAGEPGSRRIAGFTQRTASGIVPGISHTTVCKVLSRPDLSSWRNWQNVKPIAHALGADVDRLHELWHAAREAHEPAEFTAVGIPFRAATVSARPDAAGAGAVVRIPRQRTTTDVAVSLPQWDHSDPPTLEAWLVGVGDSVSVYQHLAHMTFDGHEFPLESPAAGVIVDLLVCEGVEVNRADSLATIRTS